MALSKVPNIADASELIRDLWSEGRGPILVSIALGWFFIHGIRTSYPVLLPFFRDEFGIGLTLAGVLLTALWGSYAIGQLPGGILGDRIGEGRILVYSISISALALFGVLMSFNFLSLFVLTVVFGLASALYGPTRFTVFTDIYKTRYGSAIGITMAAGSAGDAVLPVGIAIIATYISWQFSLGAIVPLLVVIAFLIWYYVPTRTSSSSKEILKFNSETISRIWTGIRVGSIPIILCVQILMSFVIQGITSFYPLYLIDVKQYTPTVAASLFALIFVVGSITQPIIGAANDKFGHRPMLLLVFLTTTVSLWFLPIMNNLAPLIVISACLGVMKGFGVITQTYFASNLPEYMKGTGLGIIRTSFILLGSLSPLFIGVVADVGYFSEAFLLLAVISTIGLIITVLRVH